MEKFINVKGFPLVFVQNAAGDSFTVYQDGKEVRGIRSIRIDAGVEEFTTHEIEYVTGATEKKAEEPQPVYYDNRSHEEFQAAFDSIREAVLSPNELRKQAIEKAKKFVEDTEKLAEGIPRGVIRSGGNRIFQVMYTKAEFVVNEEKRTVVAIVRGINSGMIKAKGIAKCAPDDVFNADIGKAIALGRAYGLDTSDFELAPQPDEVVPGMVTKGKYSGDIYTVDKLIDNPQSEDIPGQAFKTTENSFGWVSDSQVDIISDTKAEY